MRCEIIKFISRNRCVNCDSPATRGLFCHQTHLSIASRVAANPECQKRSKYEPACFPSVIAILLQHCSRLLSSTNFDLVFFDRQGCLNLPLNKFLFIRFCENELSVFGSDKMRSSVVIANFSTPVPPIR